MTTSVERLTVALSDRYRIERELGRGGMATVFLAHDVKHERSVALKVLHPELASAVGGERFLAEIKTTARLQHPHILPLYDSGEANGFLFYVMPFVDGETLRDRVDREKQLPLDEATRLIGEVADALAYAHGRGIVHRDIKPENILLGSGHALVADFGIARAVTTAGRDRITSAGMMLGTAAYMSPEQAAGDDNLDARSDIFSLGCVLFEILAGEPPFTGPSLQAVIAARFVQAAPSVTSKRTKVPPSIDAAIRTAMAREPSERYQSAARFADALSATGVVPQNGHELKKSIAVLPFANMSADADTEFFSDGIAEEILNALVRLPGLRVIARTSSFAFKGQNVDVRQVGERLGVGMVLEGSVRRAGNRVRIVAHLADAANGENLWSERYDREMNDVFAIQDEITAAIRDALSDKLLGIGRAPTTTKPAIDGETYDLFLRGRFFVAKRAEGMRKGIELLGQVVARSPGYAPAHAELATAYSLLTGYNAIPPATGWPKVREFAQTALALDPQLGRAHAELGNVAFWFDWDWAAARKHYERAVALDPNDPWTQMLFGYYWSALGRHDEAIAQNQRAVSLDPLNPSIRTGLANAHFLARQFERSVEACDRIIEIDPAYSEAYRWKGQALRELKRFDEAIATTETAVKLGNPYGLSSLSMALAAAGRSDEARALLKEMTALQSTRPVSASHFALPYAQLGEAEPYFEWMTRSYEERHLWLVMMRADAAYDPFRADPRHEALVARIGIPEWA